MGKLLTASVAALALAGTTVAAVTPADAQRWHGGGGWHGGYRGHYRGGGAGWAVGAGILGLAAGAAIASDHGYYGRPGPGYYYGGPGYYAAPPGYYYGGPRYCHSDWRWDGWAGRYVRVRYCD